MNLKFIPIGFAMAILLPQIGKAQTPFSTAVRNFAYIGKAGLNSSNNPVMLYTSANPLAAGGGFTGGTQLTYTNTAANSINGAGINPVDGFIYGLEYASTGPNSANGSVYRVGANAVASQVGTIAPPTGTDAGRPVGFSFVNTSAGTMDANGDLWFTAYTFTDLNMPFSGSKVDVFLGKVTNLDVLMPGTAPITPKYYHLDISDSILQTGYSNFMSSVFNFFINGAPVSNVNGGWQDMDLNPADGKFYSYIAFPNAATPPITPLQPEPPLNSYLTRIDVVNAGGYWGKVTLINTVANTNPNYEEDGAYFDAAGDYYALFTNGEYGKVNLADGSLGTLSPSGLPLSSGEMRGDLASNSMVLPLPITLSSFFATPTNSKVTLQWKIANWESIDNVIIQRSTDGKQFSNLASQNQLSETSNYIDENPLSTGYYRLRMIGTNGDARYSQTLRVSSGLETLVGVYPNPVIDKVEVVTATAHITLQLTDMSGRLITSTDYHTTGGQAATLDLSTTTNGSYLLIVKDTETGKQLHAQLIQKQ